MKHLFFFIILLISIQITAQEWLSKLPSDKKTNELTFYDYQKAFNEYWKPFDVKGGYYVDAKGKKQKAAGWKLFKRWEYFWQSRVNQTTGFFPENTAIDIYNEWKKKKSKTRDKSLTGNWQSMGPNSSDGGYAGTGRLNCIAFHPSDNNTYWVGSPSGGLWITADDGVSWNVLTDANSVLGVSDIAVSPNYNADNTIYIATGDKDGGSMWTLGGGQYNDTNSIGVLKSTDAGVTWNTTGLSFTTSQNQTVNRILIDPNNNDILYAATSNGIYKTTDAGINWSNIYNPGEYIIDMEFKPGTSSTIYASTKDYWGEVYIYRSTDSGANWATEKTYDSEKYRIDLAVTPDDTTYVYAVVAEKGGQLSEVSQSTNSGDTFVTKYLGGTDKNLLGYFSDQSGPQQGQGGYDLAIAVSPTNKDNVIVGGVNAHRTTDGGTNWTCSSCWTSYNVYNKGGHPVVHADKHVQKYRSNGDLFECNDGGVYKSTDNGVTWSNVTGDLVISQLYRLSVAQTRSDAVLAGLQDNGCKRLESGVWSDVNSGDGMEVIIDFNTYNTQYGSYTNGDIARTTNNWAGSTNITKDSGGNWINGISVDETGYWVTPYVIDPNNHNTLYLGLKDVWKSINNGDDWSKISTISSNDIIRSLVVAPSNSSVIYAADPTTLWLTTDGGTNWVDRTAGLPGGGNAITYVQVKENDPTTVWVTFGGYDGNRVYESTNSGVDWANISAGLPSIPTMSVVCNKQNTTETELYVSTDVGVYFKIGNNNWQQYNTGLPNVVVTELDIYYDNTTIENSRLRAGTFGRGLWETDLYTAPTGPMIYDSSTTTQNTNLDVFVGEADKEIIGVEIVTTGNENPIDITSFNFTTTGSTNPTTDIANAKVYYTNNSATFATTNQFGSVVVNPNGTFTINGAQTLISGTNYFWLAYDIAAGAVEGNFVDATCTSITVDGTEEVPSPTSPAGNRKIASCSGHCDSNGTTQYQTSTTLVNLNTINNATAKPAGYNDYTAIVTNVEQGSTYDLTVNVNTDGDYPVATKVWIDWNQDCDFDDTGEEYDLGTANNVTDGVTTNSPLAITVPVDATLGNTVMRVSTKFDSAATSCETGFDGEVEDYTINVLFACTGTTTTWDGAGWDNEVPDATKPAIISGNYNSDSGSIDCCSLTVNNGATIIIKAGEYLNIKGDFENNGIIIIQHEGSLVQEMDTPVTGNGTFEINKTTPTYLDYDYTYWSSPLDNQTIGAVFANNPSNYIFSLNTANFLDRFNGTHPQTAGTPDTFDDDNNDWELTGAGTIMQQGKGYIAMGAGSAFPLVLPPTDTQTQSVVFNTGKVNNGDISVPVTLDKYNQDNLNEPNTYSGADSFHTNANLIGNPYPSAIDISLLRTDAANVDILEGSFYFWTHDTAIATGGGPWAWNFTNDDYSTVGVDAGGVVSITGAGNDTGTNANRYIASCQGFLANVTGNGNVTFTNSMRVTDENTHFLSSGADEIKIDKFWLNLTNSAGLFRQILIGFYETASDEYQAGQDVVRMENGDNVDFYSLIAGDERHFAIQNLASFTTNKTIPLGLELIESGIYSISLDQVVGLFEQQDVFLYDSKENLLHNLSTMPYKFIVADEALYDKYPRFEIRFVGTTASIDNEKVKEVTIYPNPSYGVFTISTQTDKGIDITIYDLTGKEILLQKATIDRKIDLSNFAKGFYFAKINLDGQEVVKKLILK